MEICLPSFIPIFVAIENAREDLWQQSLSPLRKLLIFSLGSGIEDIVQIGQHTLYIAGSIGMAIAVKTKQLDFVRKWMQLPMPRETYRGGGEEPWLEIYTAHHLWGHYLPGNQNPFTEILRICKLKSMSGFFSDEQELVNSLFLGNLCQSLSEFAYRIKDVQNFKDPTEIENQKLAGDLRVWTMYGC